MNHDYNCKITSITDYGGRKILGMTGSLTDYINTGNPYANRKKSCECDSYGKDKRNLLNRTKKLPIIAGILLTAGTALYILAKKGIIDLKPLQDSMKNVFDFSKIKNKLPKISLPEFLKPKKLKNVFDFSKIKNKLPKISLPEFLKPKK